MGTAPHSHARICTWVLIFSRLAAVENGRDAVRHLAKLNNDAKQHPVRCSQEQVPSDNPPEAISDDLRHRYGFLRLLISLHSPLGTVNRLAQALPFDGQRQRANR